METATKQHYFTAAEIIAAGITPHAMLATREAGQHSGSLLNLSRLFPTTQAQAKKWHGFECLGAEDIQRIEALLNKHGMTGRYSLTKSGKFARFDNTNNIFRKALKAEYGF
jgi:hypothetical protein